MSAPAQSSAERSGSAFVQRQLYNARALRTMPSFSAKYSKKRRKLLYFLAKFIILFLKILLFSGFSKLCKDFLPSCKITLFLSIFPRLPRQKPRPQPSPRAFRTSRSAPVLLGGRATERCRFAVAPHFPTMPQSLLCLPQRETFPTCADAKKKLRACGAFHRVFLPCLRRCQTSGSSLSPAARDSSVGGASCSSPRIKRS